MFYVYECVDGHETVARGGVSDSERPCGNCGKPSPRRFANTPFIHGATTPSFQADPERFIDRAPYIEDAYQRAEQEVGAPLDRPKYLRAGAARAQSLTMQREGLGSRFTKAAVAIDKAVTVDARKRKRA